MGVKQNQELGNSLKSLWVMEFCRDFEIPLVIVTPRLLFNINMLNFMMLFSAWDEVNLKIINVECSTASHEFYWLVLGRIILWDSPFYRMCHWTRKINCDGFESTSITMKRFKQAINIWLLQSYYAMLNAAKTVHVCYLIE